jgi:hypothetical protein
MALGYISCPRQWGLRYGVLEALVPGSDRRASEAFSALPPTASKLGTLAHVGMQAAYTAASLAQWHVDDASMTPYTRSMSPYIRNALTSMKGAAIGLGLTDADRTEAEDDVVRTLRALPMPAQRSVLGVERESVVCLPSGRVFRGVPDLKLIAAAHTVHVRDWKRKRFEKLPKAAELLDDLPLAMYAYLVYQEFPDVDVTVGLYSLRSQREVSLPMPYAAAMAMAYKVDALIAVAEADEELFPTPRGGNCQRCPVIHGCPLWPGHAGNPAI